jgi:cis-3-alkyl-4-acyloxetan-2-one decarboxylase
VKLPAPELPSWLSAMVPFDRYCLKIRGYSMHVMEAGTPLGRPVLLLHGNPTWGFLWRKVVAALGNERLRLVMPDLLGLGLSDKPTRAADHTLERHADQIGGVVDALGLKDVVLVVQDWGGPIGGRAFADRADRLAGLVVLNTAMGPPKEGFRPTAFHRFAQTPVVADLAFRLGGLPQRMLYKAQGDQNSIRGDVLRAYVWPLRGLRNNVAPLALARMVPDSQSHRSVGGLKLCEALVTSFRGPSAIVWGDRDPVLGRLRGRMERMLPRADVTRTAAGHFLQEEVPEEIAAAIRKVARA